MGGDAIWRIKKSKERAKKFGKLAQVTARRHEEFSFVRKDVGKESLDEE